METFEYIQIYQSFPRCGKSYSQTALLKVNTQKADLPTYSTPIALGTGKLYFFPHLESERCFLYKQHEKDMLD